ncbi:Serine/threonine-protein kinase RIO2 [Amphibalanus amphitrite]|uniref:Serine/threonine-protein kinase RIO2 n=1 Tax=Amphibalanus amphitrite TaxID=1232801 RepID=A0A6A4X622_AMPAM|nr:serine/threonine-protein kinase rio2-like [Amphibalanus amphitrite]XP_043233597.1 serine/threonine-protein kinase rio2-like [Amphibalanus amphitrite]XP_043233598.1 serine/threonine-protein kinase rio2-like [Amphibalanus amphitrite]KAF0311464.1 Serine/threonine-protein kinase RIO2 [Amphibalanus amphitrite]
MGRLDVGILRYMSKEDFRVLQGVEMGMRNHELVSTPLACSLANLRSGGAQKVIRQLQNTKLLAYERGRRYDGLRLTVSGYDFLALHSMVAENVIDGFGNQIGTGKESDVYAAYDTHGEALALKFHRLGRTSFRKLKLLRDYHKNRSHMSWLYLSTLSARKEFSYMKALHERGFPVPRPIYQNRHAVLMSIVHGEPLCELRDLSDPRRLYGECMELMIRLAECGVIHCDFNEFNLMVTDEEHIILIDFPQMVSTSHPNAEHLFQRDVECLRRFFARRFRFESDDYPVFSEVVRTEDLDTEIRASGYGKEFAEFDTVAGLGEEDDGSETGEESDDEESSRVEEEQKRAGSEEGSEDDSFKDAVESLEEETPTGVVSEQPDRPQAFPLDSATRVALRSDTGDGSDGDGSGLDSSGGGGRSGEDSAEEGTVSSEGDEDEAAAAARRREMKRLKQRRLEEQRLAARSQLNEAIQRSASQRSRSTAASTIAPEVLQRRLARELRRKRRHQAERLRAKGDASAVTRSRRDNAATIRESTTGFWAD